MGDEEKEIEEVRTDFLFAQPSFWSGLGRWLDLSGKFDSYNVSPSGETADAFALYSDWRIVGQELRRACQNCGKQIAARQRRLFDKPSWQSHDERNQRRIDKARISGTHR
jgi:hypothetical protein